MTRAGSWGASALMHGAALAAVFAAGYALGTGTTAPRPRAPFEVQIAGATPVMSEARPEPTVVEVTNDPAPADLWAVAPEVFVAVERPYEERSHIEPAGVPPARLRTERVGAASGTSESSVCAPRPRATNRPPEYPRVARRRRWEGAVRVVATVGPDGRVSGVRVASGSGYDLLDEAALEAVRMWEYDAGTVDGAPVTVEAATTIRFVLND